MSDNKSVIRYTTETGKCTHSFEWYGDGYGGEKLACIKCHYVCSYNPGED